MSKATTYPALLGDGQGRYRVHVIGNSGSGKASAALLLSQALRCIELAVILDVPYISLDRLFWQPGWKQTPTEEFEEKIRAVLNQDERGWVVDGEYTRRGGLVAQERATDVIWLDPPLFLYLPRIIVRTFLRLFNIGDPCSPGCNESVREVFFSKESIIWWCLSHHWANRRKNRAMMVEIGLVEGTDVERRRMRRLGGWGSEHREWIRDVEKMMQETKQKVL